MCCPSIKRPVVATVRGGMPAHLDICRDPAWGWKPQELWCIQLVGFGSEQALEGLSNTERSCAMQGMLGIKGSVVWQHSLSDCAVQTSPDSHSSVMQH